MPLHLLAHLAGCATDGGTLVSPRRPPGDSAPLPGQETGAGAPVETAAGDPTDEPTPPDPGASVTIVSDGTCENPCRLTAQASPEVVSVLWSAEGWPLGEGVPSDFAVTYAFSRIGPREVRAAGLDAAGAEVAADQRTLTVLGACDAYRSQEQEQAPVQLTGAGVPAGADALTWEVPSASTWIAPFRGVPGSPATHEGIDYAHDDRAEPTVPVVAAADGVVVYVREGCPQSVTFGSNQTLRECGAGWGNHVVVRHEGGIYTRYAHLEEGSAAVRPGQPVARGEPLASMGNSGRSDLRHLHFELGVGSADPDPCAASTSFQAVHDPAALGL